MKVLKQYGKYKKWYFKTKVHEECSGSDTSKFCSEMLAKELWSKVWWCLMAK